MNRLLLTTFGLMLAIGARAQQFSSFKSLDWMSGISMNFNSTTKVLTATVNPGATLHYAGTSHTVDDFFGFYILSKTDNGNSGLLGATNGSGPAGWGFYSDHQNLAGWDDNTKMDLGISRTGTFSTIVTSQTGDFGLHVRMDGTGLTDYVRFNASTPPPGSVPEPVTMSLGFASVGLFVRRRLKAKQA